MISVIIPFHNEEKNLPVLIGELERALQHQSYEIILVDDGSTDASRHEAHRAATHNKNIRLVAHRSREGKGAAIRHGFAVSKGDSIMLMDADLQDDPRDIPKFVAEAARGSEVVNGWRKYRKDSSLMTTISSVGNKLIWRILLHSKLHDVNCGFKLFKRKVLEEIPLYGDNFRFLPIIAGEKGFTVSEVVVNNRARVHGVSKYSSRKIFFGFFDTITTYFIYRFAEKPLHFFGSVGSVFFSTGFIIALYLSYERIFHGVLLYRRPALQFAILLLIIGIQIILTGIVAELIVYLHKKKST